MSTDDEIVNHEAYAAILHIERRDWDRHLISLQIALRTRLTAEEVKTAVLKRAEFTAGDYRAQRKADQVQAWTATDWLPENPDPG